jgi:hypothetical protein
MKQGYCKAITLYYEGVADDADAKRSITKTITEAAKRTGATIEDTGWVLRGSKVKETVTPIAESKPKSKAKPKKDDSDGCRGFATAGGVRTHTKKGNKGYGHDVVFGAEGTQGMDYEAARAAKVGGYCKDCPEQ